MQDITQSPSSKRTEKKVEILSIGTFDYIIVGAGLSGCVIARRLIDASSVNVLLLDADERTRPVMPTIDTMGKSLNNKCARKNRTAYNSFSSTGAKKTPVTASKVVSGAKSIDTMVWTRGSLYDYDAWAAAGNLGWSYQGVLPLFKKTEDWQNGESDFHGQGGPIEIARVSNHPISEAMFSASNANGIPFIDDINAPYPEGVGLAVVQTARSETASAADSYLHSVIDHEQLTMVDNAEVQKICIKENKASGVIFKYDGQFFNAQASSEVILCAGAINNPKLLMLSGIGDHRELQQAGISCVQHLPGVGKNLHDHLIIQSLIFNSNRNISALAPDGPLSAIFWKSNQKLKATDLMITACPLPVPTVEVGVNYGPFSLNSFCLMPALTKVKSRRQVKLRNQDPGSPVEILGEPLSEQEDVDALVRAVEISMDVAEAPAFKQIISCWEAPKRRLNTRSEIMDFIGESLTCCNHPAGSCKMGIGVDAVVSYRLMVYGLQGLRIADASIMPEPTGGDTQAVVMMIAEFAARDILKRRLLDS